MEFAGVACLPGHDESVVGQDSRDPFAEQHGVVGQHDADHSGLNRGCRTERGRRAATIGQTGLLPVLAVR